MIRKFQLHKSHHVLSPPMANINLHTFSLPLTLSPPNFSSLHFSPLPRRFSHSSFLAKLTSDSSSQLHIISRTEHSDGTVSFKFGDASEVSQGLESADGVNGVELETDSECVDDESEGLMLERIVVTSVKLNESVTVTVTHDSESLVEDHELENSTSVPEELSGNSSLVAENSTGFGAVKDKNEVVLVEDDDLENSSSVQQELEGLSGNLSLAEEEGENLSGFGAMKDDNEAVLVIANDFVAKDDTNVDEVEGFTEELSENGSDESTSLSSVVSEEMSDGDETNSGVEGLDVVVLSLKDEIVELEVSNDAGDGDDKIDNGDDDLSVIASVEVSDVKVEYGGDESLSTVSELSVNFEVSEVAASSQDVDGDGGGGDAGELLSAELEAEPVVVEDCSVSVPSLGLENGKDSDAAFLSIVESDVGQSSTDLMEEDSPEYSQMHSADIILDSVNVDIATGALSAAFSATELTQCIEVLEVDNCSTVRLDDDSHNLDTAEAAPSGIAALEIASESTLDRENSLDIEHESSDVASSPLSSEVNGASPPNLTQSDDQSSSDVSQASVSGPDTSGLSSDKASFDSQEISAVATPTSASSLDSTDVHDTTTGYVLESDSLSDVLLAADPVTSEITSAETTLDSLNEMNTSAPALLFTSSAGASLSHSVEALAGGKDAYFISEDWFGVADGVGQWSLEGVDIGLYAHELMQNCEELIKSMNSEITNVKELLKQSDAATESTGSARVVIAHVANQVLHVANIGDSGFVVIRNGIVFKKSSPMVHEFGFPYAIGLDNDSVEDIEEYHVELEDGDVIVTATDGLFDNLYEEEIASLVSKALEDGMNVQDIAEHLATKAQEVGKSDSARSPFADAAQAAGHPGYNGGKHDHVTVIVSLVQMR